MNNPQMAYIMKPDLITGGDMDLREELQLLEKNGHELPFDVSIDEIKFMLSLDEIMPKWKTPLLKMYKNGVIKQICRVLPNLKIKAPMHFPSIMDGYEGISPRKVRVIFVGQDPYPNKDKMTNIPYACGRCFAVPDQCRDIPNAQESLRELIKINLGYTSKASPSLQEWVNQGVLLINSSLTLHAYEGRETMVSAKAKNIWTAFTQTMLEYVLTCNPNCIIVLFGKAAQTLQNFIKKINMDARLIRCPYPSKRSNGNRTFMTSDIFKRIETVMELSNESAIEW